jgi:acyltransferase
MADSATTAHRAADATDATGSTIEATAADMEHVGTGHREREVETVTSADGTPIAFERSGDGPPVVIIGGGLNEKAMFTTLADLLSQHFTVYNCDRRGRGDSGEGDRGRYTIDREVEDLAAVLEVAGPSAAVFANCTGGFIAIRAAAQGVGMGKLALYEPPFGPPSLPADDFIGRLEQLIAENRREDAITVFWSESVGFSDELIAQFKSLPAWEGFVAIAPSVVYDAIIDRDHSAIPLDLLPAIDVPTLMVVGTDTLDWIKESCAAVVAGIPGARREDLEGAGHLFSQASVAPILADFFREG